MLHWVSWKARQAACAARCTSAIPASGTCHSSWPSAGLRAGKVHPSVVARSTPSTGSPWCDPACLLMGELHHVAGASPITRVAHSSVSCD